MSEEEKQELIIRLLGKTQERLMRYVLVLLPDWNAAQDAVQNTHVIAWRKSVDFKSDNEEDFYRWIKQIAYYEVKKLLSRKATSPSLLDPELAAMINEEFELMDDALEIKRQALADCIEKLAPKDQELLRCRYWTNDTVGSLARQMGKSAAAIYKSLQRIRKILLRCTDRAVRHANQQEKTRRL